LAFCYEKGEGVEQNYSTATELYQQAANFENSDAMYNLAICYLNGKGIAKNYSFAFKLSSKVACLSDSDSMYQCLLQLSRGLEKNETFFSQLIFFSLQVKIIVCFLSLMMGYS
jgi:TPR repeat protein